ncbi:thiaminase II [Desertibaculum subflavum]|uniref:thiaminase II n=1 Tax=Desertibaculum subflavum TaxID=2268458 RepID=UPI0034D25FE3
MSPPLFDRLRDAAAYDWRAYTEHRFVRELAAGTLLEACFRHYLKQDYLFLIHFARAYALAVYKGDDLDDMRGAAAALHGILNVEMKLHVEFCAGWGLSEAQMAAEPEARATMAYTRFVLERGMAGDVLDLQVALAPCVIGYGEIAKALAADPRTRRAGNPYEPWIAMYAGAEYQQVAEGAKGQIARLGARRLTEARWPKLVETFAQACRLEAGFWQMGIDQSL